MKYTVKDVVCDYGVYEGDTLVVIVNSRKNAEIIAQILNYDWELPNTARPVTKEMLLAFWKGEAALNFAKDTMDNDHICPYCGSINVQHICGGYGCREAEARYACRDCGMDYYVLYNENSWNEEGGYFDVIEDVTDHHRRSLVNKMIL